MPIDLFKNSPKPQPVKSSVVSGTPKNLFAGLERTNISKPVNDQVLEHPLFKEGAVLGKTGANIANVVTSSEQNFGKDIAQGFYLAFGGQKKISKITQQYLDNGARLTDLAKKQNDPSMRKKYADMAISMLEDAQKVGKSIIGENRTPSQIVGDALGVGLDVALAGSYGKAAAGMKSFEFSAKAAKPVAELVVKKTLGETLKETGIKTAQEVVKGATTGYGFDVSKNLQEGKTGAEALKPGLATVVGGGVPLVIGGIKITATALKNSETAGRVVNSLIKPLQKDFAYGKDPGKVIAQEGITANSLDELATKVNERRKQIGQSLGDMTSHLEGKSTVDLSRSLDPIDMAIENAQKTPETNKALISRLQSIKNDLVNYIGGDMKSLTFAEGIDAKGTIGDLTKWTGNPSDDKIVNKALKQIYGSISEEIMKKAGKADASIAKNMEALNEKYGSLLSAESAIKHRDMILQRQNLISMPIKVGTATGLIAEVISGGNPIAAVLTGVSAGILEKALSSPAFKTRIASWLAKESPSVINALYKANPAIRNILIKASSSTK